MAGVSILMARVRCLTILGFLAIAHQLAHGEPELTEPDRDQLKAVAQEYYGTTGVAPPSDSFVAAVRAAAALQPGRPLVLLTVADVGIMHDDGTLHLLLRGLASFPLQSPTPSTPSSNLTLASALVVLVWTLPAYGRCLTLQQQFPHQCALDGAHRQPEHSKQYFSAYWLAAGFYRVSTIANALSLGYDSLFLDSDTAILRDFVPLLRNLEGADVITSTERCIVRNYGRPYDRIELGDWTANIGFTFFRAVPGNVRCTSAWMARMFWEAMLRGKTWDQSVFNVVYPDCAARYGLVWYGLDPRVFQLGCDMAGFKQCGCAFDDADFADAGPIPAHAERLSGKFLPFSAPGVCGPGDWKGWYAKHYNCIHGVNGSSPQAVKAGYMKTLMEAAQRGESAAIMPSTPHRRRWR